MNVAHMVEGPGMLYMFLIKTRLNTSTPSREFVFDTDVAGSLELSHMLIPYMVLD